MRLQKLHLQNFRQFQQKTWQFDHNLNFIIAPNASGKTTILEALYLLASGKSFRAKKTAELIRFHEEYARVYALINQDLKLGVTITPGFFQGKKTTTKQFTINQAKKRQIDFIGQFLAVCFRPEDLRLIEGSASRRRDYLDLPLILTNKKYHQARKKYEQILSRRNKVLQALKKKETTIESLKYWDENLLIYASIIQQIRTQYFNFLNQDFKSALIFHALYQPSQLSIEKLIANQPAEIALGFTLSGPHKDDFDILTTFGQYESSLLTYGSRGQHRLAVLWLKLAELNYLERQSQVKPVLLLDDIFSELDQKRQDLVWELIANYQTLITSTHEFNSKQEKLFSAYGRIELVENH